MILMSYRCPECHVTHHWQSRKFHNHLHFLDQENKFATARDIIENELRIRREEGIIP
jgi:hypothetical protein